MKIYFGFILMLITFDYSIGQSSIYDFTVKTIDNTDFPFSQLKGKKVLIVNTASKCGLTPQYADLETLYSEYSSKNFVIIGFPANNFLGQEPGTNEEIKNFCSVNYKISFPIMAKISVKGDDIAPIYKWLTQKSQNGKFDSVVKWNFQKFLISEKGELVDVVDPKDKPNCEKIINWLNN